MAGDLSDVQLRDDGVLGFVGVSVVFDNPAGPSAIPVYGALAFSGPVFVSRPPPPSPPPSAGGISRVGGVGGAGAATGGVTFGLGSTAGYRSTDLEVEKKKVGSVFTRLHVMRKTPDLYPLYEAIDALIEAVLDLNRR